MRLILAVTLALAGLSTAGRAQPVMQTITLPAAPPPVSVTLDHATTALVLLDMSNVTCLPQKICMEQMLPRVRDLLARARAAGMMVVYTHPNRPNVSILPEVAPQPGEKVLIPDAQDKFYGSSLEADLKARGVTHVVLAGWRMNGSVVYTSVGATLRGFTVVVAQDASLAPSEADIAIGRYQAMTQLSANETNAKLKPHATTLSLASEITFR